MSNIDHFYGTFAFFEDVTIHFIEKSEQKILQKFTCSIEKSTSYGLVMVMRANK